MEFLCQHNFDFNKWIYEGIPYCNAKEVCCDLCMHVYSMGYWLHDTDTETDTDTSCVYKGLLTDTNSICVID